MALLILNTLAGEESPLTGFYDFKRTLKINGDYMITFSIDRNERNAAQFDQLVNKNKLVLDGDAFIIDDMERDPDGGTVTKEITARHEMFDRLYANWVSEEYTAQKSLQDWMAIVLANTGLDVEITGDFPPEQYENFGNDNSLNMFKDLIDRFQVEYRVYGTRIVIEKHIGIQRDAQFRHGHNLKTFSDEFNTDNLVTRVTAKGKNDDNGNPVVQVTVDSPNQDKFERIYAIAVQDERFTQEDSLTEFAESQFNEGDYSAKVEFIELVKNGLKLHEYDVGDNVWCIYDKQGMGLDLSVRIVGQDDNPFDKSVSPVVTLGTEQNNVITSFQTKTNEIQEIAKQANQNAILAIVQANGKNRNFYTDEEPTEGMIAGDIWFEKINGQYLRKYHYDGTQWILDVSADANDALNKAADALESANGKNTVYHQSAQPIAGNNGDVWFQQNADGTISLNIYQDGTWSDPTIDGVKAAQDDAATAVSTASAASNAAGSALSNAQTAINTANNAAGTASTAATNAQTAINTAQSAVSAANAANSAATAAQQSISTKVWMSDVNGAVANVQVGGTNLIPNSLDFNNTNFYKIGSHIETSLSSITLPDGTTGNALKLSVFSDSDNGLYRMTNVVPRNGAYTFSVWYRTANDDNSNVTCESDIADAPPGQGGTIVATNVWQRYSTTATIGNHDDGVHNFVDLYVVPGNSVYLYKPKLEVGNVATDWSPAPADMATATQFSQLNQTVNGISTQVSNKVDSSTYNSYTAQTDNTIATLLTKTDAAGTYATQSALSQTSSSLSSQISSVQSSANSYTDSRITQTSTSLQSTITAAVAAVQVGGVNLLSWTGMRDGTTGNQLIIFAPSPVTVNTQVSALAASPSGYQFYVNRSDNTTNNGGAYWAAPVLTVGNTYTWSVWLRASGTWNIGHEQGSIQAITPNSSVFTRYTYTFTANNGPYHGFEFYTTSQGVSLYAYGLKLEEGNKATTWCDAPADMATQSQFTQLSNDINLRVSKNDVVNQINLSTESILIAGNKVHITGQTTIDNASIQSAAIAQLDAGKITTGTLDTNRIAAGSITAQQLNVANLAAISANLGNVTAGDITGVNIHGVVLTAQGKDKYTGGISTVRIGGATSGAITNTVVNINGSDGNLDLGQKGMILDYDTYNGGYHDHQYHGEYKLTQMQVASIGFNSSGSETSYKAVTINADDGSGVGINAVGGIDIKTDGNMQANTLYGQSASIINNIELGGYAFIKSGDGAGSDPAISLAIGDNDTGFMHTSDGYLNWMNNYNWTVVSDPGGSIGVRTNITVGNSLVFNNGAYLTGNNGIGVDVEIPNAGWCAGFRKDGGNYSIAVRQDVHADNGDVFALAFVNTSRVELKQDITALDESIGLTLVNALDIYKFKYKKDVEYGRDKFIYGGIIGDGYQLPDDFKDYDEQGINVYSATFIGLKAVQELFTMHQEDATKIADLETRLSKLEAA